jgi:transcriptional regulator with GAF, ATPase, and Fis domain
MKFLEYVLKFAKYNNIKNDFRKIFKEKENIRVAIYGASNSGKSYIARKIIKQNSIRYKKILYFLGSDNTSIRKLNFITYLQINEDFPIIIKSIFDLHKKMNKKTRNKSRILIIIDDIQSYLKECSYLFKVITYSRHLNIDLCLICQYYTMLPILVRTQCTHSIYKKIMQKNIISQIYSNMSNFEYSEKKFIKFVRLFQKNYRTLIIDHSNNNEIYWT